MAARQAAARLEGDAAYGEQDAEQLRRRNAELEHRVREREELMQEGFRAFETLAEDLNRRIKSLQHQVDDRDAYLSSIFESLPVGVLVLDAQGQVRSCNPRAQALLGLEEEQLYRQALPELLGFTLPQAGPPGATGSAELSRSGQVVDYTLPDGEVRKMQLSLAPRRSEQEKQLGWLLHLQDVTQLKQLEERAHRRNRLTAMGEMAANIAHEIRNPLGGIELFADLLKKGMAPQDDKYALICHISAGIASMNHVISNVLEYTKPRPAQLQRVSVLPLLHQVVAFLRHMAAQNQIELRETWSAQTLTAHADPQQLRQVFHNLLLNGVQAMPEGGLMRVHCQAETLTEKERIARLPLERDPAQPPLQSLAVIAIRFTDQGCGMDAETRRQAFDPFFTTRGRGTGLGLAIVQTLVENCQGALEVQSQPGKGSVFTLLLPAAGEDA